MSDDRKSVLSSRKRKQILVHKSQKTFAIWIGLVLFAYSVFLFFLAFAGPYIYHAMKLIIPLSLEEQGHAATQMLLLVQDFWPVLLGTIWKIWPLLILAILIAAILSIYMTHKFSGPLYRLQESAKQIAQGTLSFRIQLRKGDYLQELADVINHSMENLDHALMEIRGRNMKAAEILQNLAAGKTSNANDETQKNVANIEVALQECRAINNVLTNFSLSDAKERNDPKKWTDAIPS